MVKKKTKRIKPLLRKPILDDSETLILSKNKPNLTKELLNQIPWLKNRYLLPGEDAKEYDLRLQALVDSIEIHNALDAILVKDIHDELREMHRLRTLRNTLLLDGMRKHLNKKLGVSSFSIFEDEDADPEISKFIMGWLDDDESVVPAFVDFIENKGITLAELLMQAYKDIANNIVHIDNQMTRHQKNVRETLKLIEMRRNNTLARQRIEQEIERLNSNSLVVEHDEP